ncbi:hypothetical protein AYM40_30525 [Paraburkholderia phytofirmans OLGA172]|uniref:Uncharacterized protein n=1 Tax=Paraburkholderia phytofirmans OLGA172 TaxID=1417228 RepID=A0A161HZW0_9BURK|nr:hypothetical protein AYM40_30525 [Paraburkholderia phytofirmans OLGA172]
MALVQIARANRLERYRQIGWWIVLSKKRLDGLFDGGHLDWEIIILEAVASLCLHSYCLVQPQHCRRCDVVMPGAMRNRLFRPDY